MTDYDYDQFGRLITTTMAKGTADEAIHRNEYDQSKIGGRAGLPTTTIDANGNRTSLQYDAMNRVEVITEPDPDAAGPLLSPVTQFTYDAEGNLETTTDPLGNRTSFAYDSRNRQIAVTDSDPDGGGPLPPRSLAMATTQTAMSPASLIRWGMYH